MSNMGTSLNGSNSECLKVVGEPECINVQMASFNMDEVKSSGEPAPTSTLPIFEKNTLTVVPGNLEKTQEASEPFSGGWSQGFGSWGRRLFIFQALDSIKEKAGEGIGKITNKLKKKCMQKIAKYQEKIRETNDPNEKFIYSLKL